jgi:hypothetical protein
MGGYGKRHLMLTFEGGESAPVIIAVEGDGYRMSFVTHPESYRAELVERGAMKVEDISR